MVTAVWKASFLICGVWGVGPYFLTDIVQQFIGLVKSPGGKITATVLAKQAANCAYIPHMNFYSPSF